MFLLLKIILQHSKRWGASDTWTIKDSSSCFFQSVNLECFDRIRILDNTTRSNGHDSLADVRILNFNVACATVGDGVPPAFASQAPSFWQWRARFQESVTHQRYLDEFHYHNSVENFQMRVISKSLKSKRFSSFSSIIIENVWLALSFQSQKEIFLYLKWWFLF